MGKKYYEACKMLDLQEEDYSDKKEISLENFYLIVQQIIASSTFEVLLSLKRF